MSVKGVGSRASACGAVIGMAGSVRLVFFLFDEVTDAVVDMPRVERFLSLFSEARHTARQRACRATSAHVANVDAGANKNIT